MNEVFNNLFEEEKPKFENYQVSPEIEKASQDRINFVANVSKQKAKEARAAQNPEKFEDDEKPIPIAGMPSQIELPEEIKYLRERSLEEATPIEQAFAPKTLSEYVKSFRQSEERTARSNLEMSRVVYEASETLNDYEFKDFCTSIGYKDYSSAIRKFIAIGRVYPRFIDYADKLPSSWTSIYLITQIPAKEFDLIESNNLSLKDLTGKELELLLKRTKDVSKIHNYLHFDKKNSGYPFAKMLFTKTPDDTDWRAAQKALNEISARLPVKFLIDNKVSQVMDQRKEKRYEQTKKNFTNIELRPDLWDLGAEANAIYKTIERVSESDNQPVIEM